MKLYSKSAGNGPPLVLIHGGMGSVNHWDRNFDALAQHYTVHALDMPGYGESPWVSKEMPCEAFVALVMAGLNDIVPTGAFRLAGFSLGGAIAALCAAQLGTRVHKLSLMGPGGFGGKQPDLGMKRIPKASEGDALMREVLGHNLRVMMIADPLKVTEEAVDLHLTNVLRTRYDGRHISLTPDLMTQALQKMTCGVQIIWGAADALCIPNIQPRVDECRTARPDVRIDSIEGAGHWVMYEAADEVNALMLDFMK